MNLKKEVKRLKEENIMLKLENLKLHLKIQELNSEWAHPRSCLHNDDPWPELKP